MEAFLRLVWGSVRLAGAGLAVLLLAIDVSQRGGPVLVPSGLIVAAVALAPTALTARAVIAVTVSLVATALVTGTGVEPYSFGLAEAGGLGVLLVHGTRQLPRGRAHVLVPLTALAVLALPARLAGPPLPGAPTVLLAACVGLAVGVGLSLRFQDELRVRAAAQARTDDRLVLARDLHDTVAHAVTGMVVRAQAAQVVAPAGPVHAALEDIEREGSRALAEMRRVVGLLRSGDGRSGPAGPRWWPTSCGRWARVCRATAWR